MSSGVNPSGRMDLEALGIKSAGFTNSRSAAWNNRVLAGIVRLRAAS